MLNVKIPYDPAIPVLREYPKELKTHIHTKTFPCVIIAAFFIIANHGNDPHVHEPMNMPFHVMEYSVIKRNEVLIRAM